MASATPAAARQQPSPVLVRHQGDRILLHFDQPRSEMSLPQALDCAWRLVAEVRAARREAPAARPHS